MNNFKGKILLSAGIDECLYDAEVGQCGYAACDQAEIHLRRQRLLLNKCSGLFQFKITKIKTRTNLASHEAECGIGSRPRAKPGTRFHDVLQ